MNAVPTSYGGFRFRSRLEARWAAFFDVLRWPWQYEAVDLAGYIPDFILPFDHAPVLVEVRPIVSFEWRHTCHDGTTRECLQCTASKIENSGWRGEYLIVGSQPMELVESWYPRIGPLSESYPSVDAEDSTGPNPSMLSDSDHAMVFRCLSCDEVSLCADYGTWRCRRCGAWDGNSFVGPLPERLLIEAWESAATATQWKPGRAA